MDSITHVALGAVVGEAIAGKVLGKRAMFFGAIAQSIPDIDFVASFWLSPADNLLAHRGFTHSFLFGIITTAILAFIGKRSHPAHKFSYGAWSLLFGIEILIHLLLDACNAYGVGWFEPFSSQRFSFNILFVADPFYSTSIFIAMIALITLSSKSNKRRLWIGLGLSISTIYFVYAVVNKKHVNDQTEFQLSKQNLPYKRYFTTPTPLNSWLWYVVVESDKGFYTSYRSTADDENEPMHFTWFPKQHDLIKPFGTAHEIQQLKRFSQDYYTIQTRGDTILFNDLRFGQIAGWEKPDADFVFHYYVNYPKANLLVIQRGRFSNWNKKTFGSMIDRIKGKDHQ
jgi:inner membrane protein